MFIAKIIFNGPLNWTFKYERSPVLSSLTILCRCIAEFLCICYPVEVMTFESTSGWFRQHSAGKLCILSFIWRVLGCIPPTLISLKSKYTPLWQQCVMIVASLNRTMCSFILQELHRYTFKNTKKNSLCCPEN